MSTYSFVRSLVFSGLLSLFLGSSIAAAAEKLEKTRIGYPTISASFAPWWVAIDTGIFKEEGLDADMVYIVGGTSVVQSLMGGDIQVGYAGAPPALSAIAEGAPLVIVAVPENRLAYVLATREPIKNPKELHGKKFAIARLGDSSELATRLAIEKAGADPNKVTIVQVGGSPDRIAALRTGSVDAAILSGTEYIGAGGMGFHTVLDLTKSDIEYPFDAVFLTRRFAAEKRKAVLGLIKGLTRGLWFLRDKREEALKMVARRLRNPDMEVLRRQWRYVAFDSYQEVPYPTEKGLKLALAGLAARSPKLSALRIGDIVDTSFVDELLKTGFFKRNR